nr:hypothetical protein [Luteimonas padinae]
MNWTSTRPPRRHLGAGKAVHRDPVDHQRYRAFAGVDHAGGVEHRDPGRGRHPQLAAGHAPARRGAAAVALPAGHAVIAGEGLDIQLRGHPAVDVVEGTARDPEHPAVGAGPEIAEVVGKHAEQGASRQAVAAAVQGEATLAQAQQAAVAGDPQRAVRIGQEVEGGLGRKVLLRFQHHHAAVRPAARHAPDETDPERAVARPVQGAHRQRRQAGQGLLVRLPIAPGLEPALAAHPQRPVGIFEHCAHVFGGKGAAGRRQRPQRRPGTGTDMHHAAVVGPRPDPAVGRQRQRQHRSRRAAGPGHHGLDPAVAHPAQAAGVPDPGLAVGGFHDAADVFVAQPLFTADAPDRPVADAE